MAAPRMKKNVRRPIGKKMAVKRLPPRGKVKPADMWDLSSLFPGESQWESALKEYEGRIAGYEPFRGRLGESAKLLGECLQFDSDLDRLGEKVAAYAFLRASEDQGDSAAQRMRGRFQHAATRASEAASFIRPEILEIDPHRLATMLESAELSPWRVAIERLVRHRPHTLGRAEEQLLAMQGQMSEASNQIFRQLTDADLKFGMIRDEKGERIELGHSSYSALLHSHDRRVRKTAFHQYYAQFEAHQHSLTAALDSSVQRDVYYAKARKYPSARDAALFADNVPVSVYDNLIESVHAHLPALYRYLEVRRRALKVKELHQYDTYVPLVEGVDKRRSWDVAVRTVLDSLGALGPEYRATLEQGLTSGRWCDRYPNAGKQSGAFSYGAFDTSPYILMNYQPQVLGHVFTLAHEAGHSMHSWYSARSQPFQYYNYTIFVAEVASTFNEQLLLDHMTRHARGAKEKAYFLSHAIDEIRGTIIRQTMFAEFEKITHKWVESGEPLTIQGLRAEYRKLLELYFGPDFVIDPQLELECLRIPHFYRAFYVYKYATGLSAAIALSRRVLNGGAAELDDYLGFLKGGCSKWPLDLLRGAGVDMEHRGPVDAAMNHFAALVDELDELL